MRNRALYECRIAHFPHPPIGYEMREADTDAGRKKMAPAVVT
jgi:hypothetical protein